MLRIVGNSFSRLESLIFYKHAVDLLGCKDAGIFQIAPKFPSARVVFFRDCSPQFVSRWFQPYYFPKVQAVLIDSPITNHFRMPKMSETLPPPKIYILVDKGYSLFSLSSHSSLLHLKCIKRPTFQKVLAFQEKKGVHTIDLYKELIKQSK